MGEITNTPASFEWSLSTSPRATGVENECQLEEEDSAEDEDMAELFAEEDAPQTRPEDFPREILPTTAPTFFPAGQHAICT